MGKNDADTTGIIFRLARRWPLRAFRRGDESKQKVSRLLAHSRDIVISRDSWPPLAVALLKTVVGINFAQKGW